MEVCVCSAQNNGRTSVNFRSICAYDRATCTRAGSLGQTIPLGCTVVLISYDRDCDMHDNI